MSTDIPQLNAFLEPILRILSEANEPLDAGSVKQRVADRLALTEEQRSMRIPSGRHITHRHRTGWAKNILKHAGFVTSPTRGIWALTEAGRSYLAAHPDPLSDIDLRELRNHASPEISEVHTKSGNRGPAERPVQRA